MFNVQPSDLNGSDHRPRDRVRTRSGRIGVTISVRNEIANVAWDDGDEFQIRIVHLEILARNAEFPEWYRNRTGESSD